MARYHAGVDDADVAWKLGRIMLKFRPIAPKPLTGGGLAAAGQPEGSPKLAGRGKRKIYGGREGKRGRTSKKVVAEEKRQMVTLPLMPETPERKEESPPSQTASTEGHVSMPYFHLPTWQRRSNNENDNYYTGSWVTVEGVTDTWRGVGVGMVRLEKDTCPVFVSDEFDRVTWTNPAYRKMVAEQTDEEEEEEEEEEHEMRVALETKGMIPSSPDVTCFTCRVRVRYACRRKGNVLMAVPCDVWRLAAGKLAWRLDVKAALSLALGS